MMNRITLTMLALLLGGASLFARSLDDIRLALEQSSVDQLQEKVYIHTDNTCYFVGDTLWYKAYVVRADNLQPTDMSRILYVELLSPDGLLVERQNIIVAPEGHTCGQFVLRDSLYSGYYELRAYTRWMLNFNQTEHPYNVTDTWLFFNKQMARDYFRMWDGLYSRVLPIYSKPETAGDYDVRRMYQRPKQRLQKPKKEELIVSFFPEGGQLVEGLESRVAFEVTDQLGEAVSLEGTLWQGDRKVAEVRSGYMGRGLVSVTPGSERLKARFRWRGKDYTFDLPRAERKGAVMTLDGDRLRIRTRQLSADRTYGVSVLCRGALKHFQKVDLSAGAAELSLPMDSLPVGVNDVTLFDSEGQVLADRLFFKGGLGPLGPRSPRSPRSLRSLRCPLSLRSPLDTTYAPYQPITIDLQLPANTTFSLAVRDTRTDEPTYDDGNLMTDLLLGSELRGFIARPAYYFESDDEEHRRNLDLLMMVQGWRKYRWQEHADTTFVPRYEPERTMTVSGSVYRMLGIAEVLQEEVTSWQNGVGRIGEKPVEMQESENENGETVVDIDDSVIEYGNITDANTELGVNHGGLRHEVLVEAEVVMGEDIVAAVQKTHDGGRYLFQIPPFYGTAFLNLKAYREKDSLQKSMLSRKDTHAFREDAFADYYVKRDMPFPVFTHEYGFYENHAPEWVPTVDEDSLSELSMENDVVQLQNVNVKGRRRGKRGIDWNKPAFVRDAYDLYNDVTDYGLSFGKFDMRLFPQQVATFLYGNMGRLNRRFNIDGRLMGQTYWRNYSDIIGMGPTDAGGGELQQAAKRMGNRSDAFIFENLKLARLQDVRVFSDYEPRKEDSLLVESYYAADATVELQNIPDNGRQLVYRDRHIYFNGFNEPADFYRPDYSHRVPAPLSDSPADYRRTLYWNPNARSDGQGRFSVTFYNNARDTRIKISAAGVTPDGRLLSY